MSLNIDKSKLTIMGVKFNSQKDFKGVYYVLSTNMIEGWKPEKHDVEEMQEYIAKKIKSKSMDKFPLYDMYYYVDPNNEYTYPNFSVLKIKWI